MIGGSFVYSDIQKHLTFNLFAQECLYDLSFMEKGRVFICYNEAFFSTFTNSSTRHPLAYDEIRKKETAHKFPPTKFYFDDELKY